MKNLLQLRDERRVGRFYIPVDFLEGSDPDTLAVFFSTMIIVEARMIYARDEIQYTAYSTLFEMNDENAWAPFYDIVMSEDGALHAEKVTARDFYEGDQS